MYTDTVTSYPEKHAAIELASKAMGFSMPSDLLTGALLRALAASKPSARLLEIGTGTGLATAWLLAGMDAHSRLISIDSEAAFQAVARQWLWEDSRLQLFCEEAGDWISKWEGDGFDLIFADAWPGKYSYLPETLALLRPGGIYLIDDMLPQPNWPDNHQQKVYELVSHLESRTDVQLVKLAWSTGLMLVVKQ